MKKILLLLSFLFLSIETNCANIDSLMIRYDDWDKYPVQVSTCSNFERQNGYTEEYIVSSRNHIDTLKHLLSRLPETEDVYFPVRCKLYFFDSDTVRQEVCMNKTYIVQNGKTYANNDTIVNYINRMRCESTPSDDKRFMPDHIGANYIEGNDSLFLLLQKKIDEIACFLKYEGEMVMSVKCKADKEGNTTDTKVKVIRPQIPTKIEEDIAQRLREYVISDVHWEKDINRGTLDWIIFSIRYVGNNQ